MQNKFKLNIIVSSVVVLLFLGGVFLMATSEHKNFRDYSDAKFFKETGLDPSSGFPFGGGGDMSTEYEDLIKNLFYGWMSERGGYDSYEVNWTHFFAIKREAVTDAQKSYFPEFTTDDAFITTIDFSVKPLVGGNNDWQAGNGEIQEDGSILHKTLFLLIDKVDGEYKLLEASTGI